MATTPTVTGHSDTRLKRRPPVTATNRGATETDTKTSSRNNWPGIGNEAQIRRIRLSQKSVMEAFTGHQRSGVHDQPPANSPTISGDSPGRSLIETSRPTVRGNLTTRTDEVHRTQTSAPGPIPGTNGRRYQSITTSSPGQWPIGPGNQMPHQPAVVGV
jgi:hypothetical protein